MDLAIFDKEFGIVRYYIVFLEEYGGRKNVTWEGAISRG